MEIPNSIIINILLTIVNKRQMPTRRLFILRLIFDKQEIHVKNIFSLLNFLGELRRYLYCKCVDKKVCYIRCMAKKNLLKYIVLMDHFRSPTSHITVGYIIISQKTGIIITSFSYVSSCSTFCLSATIRNGFKTLI